MEKEEHHQKDVGQAELCMVIHFLLSLFPINLNSDILISHVLYLSSLSWITVAVLLGGRFNKKGFLCHSVLSIFSTYKNNPFSPLMPRQFSTASFLIKDFNQGFSKSLRF